MSDEMLSNIRGIAVDAMNCINNNCSQNCGKNVCDLCAPCIDSDNIGHMKQAYREHARRGNFKRVFPAERNFNEEFVTKMTPKNQMSVKWFEAKCRENNYWC